MPDGNANLLCGLLHVVPDQIVALRVEQDGEAPRIFEGHKMRLARMEVEMHDLERADLLLGSLRAFQTLSKRTGGHCFLSTRHTLVELKNCWRTCSPYQEGALVSPTLEVCHDAVDNVGFRSEEVDGIGVGLGLAPVLDALDVCRG